MKRRRTKRRGVVVFGGCVCVALATLLPRLGHAEQPFTPPRLFGPGGPLSPWPPGEPKPSLPGPPLVPMGQGGSGDAPVFSALFNPVLAPLGKWTARIEAAPVRFVSLLVDGSLLKVDFPNIPTIEGKSVEIGAHVWPAGAGLRGFYIGPRYLYGKGDANEVTGKLTGFGFDVGYQLVLGHFALNLGAGVESGKLELIPKGDPAVLQTVDPKLFERLARENGETRVLPVATIGLGFALLAGAASAGWTQAPLAKKIKQTPTNHAKLSRVVRCERVRRRSRRRLSGAARIFSARSACHPRRALAHARSGGDRECPCCTPPEGSA